MTIKMNLTNLYQQAKLDALIIENRIMFDYLESNLYYFCDKIDPPQTNIRLAQLKYYITYMSVNLQPNDFDQIVDSNDIWCDECFEYIDICKHAHEEEEENEEKKEDKQTQQNSTRYKVQRSITSEALSQLPVNSDMLYDQGLLKNEFLQEEHLGMIGKRSSVDTELIVVRQLLNPELFKWDIKST